MFRFASVLVALALFVAVAGAQPRQFPLSPGVMPSSPYGPGMPLVQPNAVPQRPVFRGNTVFFPVALPWGWGTAWGYQTYNPWTGYGYAYGGLVPPYSVVPAQPVPAEPANPPERTIVLANEFPATLTLQFPAAAEVWLDDKKVSGDPAEERVLKSPVLKPGQQYTFYVKGRWTHDGKTYEAKRAVTLGPGDRSRLLIVSGEEVK